MRITVDPKHMGRVIGKQASAFTAITRRSFASYIWYFKEDSTVKIWGTQRSCDKASQLIMERMTCIQKAMEDEAALDTPIAHVIAPVIAPVIATPTAPTVDTDTDIDTTTIATAIAIDIAIVTAIATTIDTAIETAIDAAVTDIQTIIKTDIQSVVKTVDVATQTTNDVATQTDPEIAIETIVATINTKTAVDIVTKTITATTADNISISISDNGNGNALIVNNEQFPTLQDSMAAFKISASSKSAFQTTSSSMHPFGKRGNKMSVNDTVLSVTNSATSTAANSPVLL